LRVRTIVKQAWRQKTTGGSHQCQLEVRFTENATGDAVLNVSEEQFDSVRDRMNRGEVVELVTEVLLGNFDKPVPSC
jgi:hypothetical protein